jgi:K+-sensing histidine kinase KdpD
MQRLSLSLVAKLLERLAKAVLSVAGTTAVLLLFGRAVLGEAVIALAYLVPVGWSAGRWGQRAGVAAAVSAALCFDYFFIPPFHTFTVGSLEGWLVLAFFLAVAIMVVGRIQSGLTRALASERDAMFMYELTAALAGQRTQAAVAHTLAEQLQQTFQAAHVQVLLQPRDAPALAANAPSDGAGRGRPDRDIMIWNGWGLVGEIRVWRGLVELPPQESRLFQNYALQAGQALERTQHADVEARPQDPALANVTNRN